MNTPSPSFQQGTLRSFALSSSPPSKDLVLDLVTDDLTLILTVPEEAAQELARLLRKHLGTLPEPESAA